MKSPLNFAFLATLLLTILSITPVAWGSKRTFIECPIDKSDNVSPTLKKHPSSAALISQQNKPAPSASQMDDTDLTDPDFLKELQKIEEGYQLKQEATTQKVSPVSSPLVVPASNNDDIFYDPVFLASVAATEAVYLSKMKSPSVQKGAKDDLTTKLLNTFESHQDHLFASIKKANKSILITSHSFSASIHCERNLFEALHQASLRNVKIYLYFNKDYGLKEKETRFLEKAGIRLNNSPVHSKLLVVDKTLITCGSYDWLSSTAYAKLNKEASLVLEGKDLSFFTEEIWQTLKQYNRIAYQPNSVHKIERHFEQLGSQVRADDETDEEHELLTTPQQHDEFFLECLETAKHKLTVCVPFITKDRRLLESLLPHDLVVRLLQSEKILQIYYRDNDENISYLRQHLARLTNPNLMLLPIKNLHRKTLIIDETYVEGSFNWLSSARTLEDDYFLMETSFILKGAKAKLFIENFYRSLK